jgi:hypothetical protein
MDAYNARLVEYEKYLVANRLVNREKVKYYSNWADKFLHGINYREEAIGQNSFISFVNSMGSDKRYAEWQVRQAENAVRIYINNFLKLDMRPKAPTKEVEEKRDKVLSWDGAILKVKDCMRLRHYSYSTEKTYIAWLERFRDYTVKESADVVSEEDVRNFLTYLAVNQHVSASTQNQSFNALLFFFRYALEREMGDMKDNVRAKRPLRLPVVFSVHEVARIISHLDGTPALMVKLMYGCGLRLNECMRLRVNSMDFERGLLHLRAAKGDKDRMVPMPVSLKEELKAHLQRLVKRQL